MALIGFRSERLATLRTLQSDGYLYVSASKRIGSISGDTIAYFRVAE
jgi:hypothetical protein